MHLDSRPALALRRTCPATWLRDVSRGGEHRTADSAPSSAVRERSLRAALPST
jgi:hypothetical protein